MRILIIAPNWIGDAVMSLSFIQALVADRKLAESSRVGVLADVVAPLSTAPVYTYSKHINRIHVADFKHGRLQLSLRRQLGLRLRQFSYDVAYVLPNSLKSSLLPWFAKTPVRIGYSGELRSLFLNRVLTRPDKNSKPPMVQWYGALGGYSECALRYPELEVAPAYLNKLLHSFRLKKGFLAFAPGAEFGPSKQWPARHFASVASTFLRANDGQQVVIFGSKKDNAMALEIERLVDSDVRQNVTRLTGQTKLEQAIALLSAASALVTNDSGLMHVGAGLGLNVHAVFGSSSPLHTPPLSDLAQVYSLNLSCSPCYQRHCPLGHTNCLVNLGPELILKNLTVLNHND